MKEDIKEQARLLRQNGYSFREISEKFGIAKSTAGLWCRKERVTSEGLKRLKKLGDDGRLRSIETIKEQQRVILENIDQNCTVLKNKNYSKDEYKLFLALLYWGEGAKTSNSVDFINSDPAMIKLYLWLFRNSFVINEDKFRVRIHLHNYHNQTEMIDFWSSITAIPKNHFSIYNKPNTGINKRPGYKGCLSIRYGDSRIIKEVFLIMKRLENFPNIAGLV
jgi:transposase